MKQLLFMIFLLCFGFVANAQTESNSKKISKIQKDKHYIWAEGIDDTETDAYKAADVELQTRINEYIIESGIAEETKEVIVKNISQLRNEIKMERGGMYRIFLYVNQKDIVESTSPTKVITIQRDQVEQEEQQIEQQQEEVMQQEETQQQEDVLQQEEQQEMPETQSVEPLQENADQPSSYGNAQKTQVQEKSEAKNIKDFFSTLSENRLAIIRDLSKSNDLLDAKTKIEKLYNSNLIKNFGVKKDCKDEKGSYWIVPINGGVTVLSPVRDSQRWNFTTGNTDSLSNYKSGLWIKL